jgi:hypothetical protein
MPTIVRREVRKRGFFGWVFLLIFLLFNAFMIGWLITYWNAVSGVTVGSTIGTGIIFFFWTAGAVITGLLAILTRGRKTYVEEIRDR